MPLTMSSPTPSSDRSSYIFSAPQSLRQQPLIHEGGGCHTNWSSPPPPSYFWWYWWWWWWESFLLRVNGEQQLWWKAVHSTRDTSEHQPNATRWWPTQHHPHHDQDDHDDDEDLGRAKRTNEQIHILVLLLDILQTDNPIMFALLKAIPKVLTINHTILIQTPSYNLEMKFKSLLRIVRCQK